MKTDAYKPQHLKPKKRRLLTTGSLLCYLLIAVVMSTGASFSKYTTSVSGSDSARVARFEVSAAPAAGEDEKTITLASVDDVGTYTFSVSSNSEVAVEYDVVVSWSGELPDSVTMVLYDSNNNEISGVTQDSNSYIFSNAGSFEPNQALDNEHTLTVTANSFDEPLDSRITIEVIASQID